MSKLDGSFGSSDKARITVLSVSAAQGERLRKMAASSPQHHVFLARAAPPKQQNKGL